MRHRRKGRRLGRSAPHRKAMMRNMASSLFLTERDAEFDDNAPAVKGRIVTTLPKAKEVRPLVERCITIARRSLKHQAAAEEFASTSERGTDSWKSWRTSDQYQKWNEAMAPAIAARRRVLQMLGDKQAVSIVFDEIAPRFADRPGGYTRIMRLAKPRLGDAGQQVILEFVGVRDRVFSKSSKPAFDAGDEGGTDTAAPPAEVVKSPDGKTADDLKVVEGIGPKVEEALKAAGIGSWQELAAAEADRIREILSEAEGNFSGQEPTTWPEQAQMAVDGEWEKLQKWQDELDGGKVVEASEDATKEASDGE